MNDIRMGYFPGYDFGNARIEMVSGTGSRFVDGVTILKNQSGYLVTDSENVEALAKVGSIDLDMREESKFALKAVRAGYAKITNGQVNGQ